MNKKEKLKFFKKTREGGWAMGQFNVSNLETLMAIFHAVKVLKSPVIIGTSEGESKFIGLNQAVALVEAFRKETGIPAFLNLDHGKTFEYIKEAAEAGYDFVHFDGSALPLKENIEITKKVVKFCEEKEVLVEGEVGFIGGSSEILEKNPETSEADLTKPEEAKKFIEETGVFSLAVSVGNNHGVDASGKSPNLDLKRLQEIKNAVGDNVFLVLHGGSGVPDNDIAQAIKIGISKININTELRSTFTSNLKEILLKSEKEIASYKYMPEVIEAVQKVVESKIKLFNSLNKI